MKEFAAKIGMAGPNVLRAVNRRHDPTQTARSIDSCGGQASADADADRAFERAARHLTRWSLSPSGDVALDGLLADRTG